MTGIAWVSYVSATMISSEKVVLGARERVQLESRVCGDGKQAELVDAERVETKPPSLSVRIACAPYGAIAGYTALKTGECEKSGAKWSCGEPALALRMHIRSEDLLVEYVDSVSADVAIQLVKFVNETSTFNGQDVSVLLSGSCRISDGHTVPFPGALNFNLACGGPEASITRDCWNSQCRFFFTDFGIRDP
jgi:hypothetical protein